MNNQYIPQRLNVVAIFTAIILLASSYGIAQNIDTLENLLPVPSSERNDIDFEKSINAVEHGLSPDKDEDQSQVLNSIMKAVADDPLLDAVYIPEGRYYIAKSIYLRPNVNLVGDGIGRTLFYRGDDSNYLVRSAGAGDFDNTLITNISFHNPGRTLLINDVHHLRFHNVEFEGGLVRFEKSSHVSIEQCFFNRNLGKGGYASSNCSDMRIVHNRFLSIENGSINLSGHKNSYVAYNHIIADKPIDSGYAGIRLPNSATGNIIEHNYIENHGRGLFVLTYSTGNTLRHNTIKSTTHQGILIQTSDNVVENNMVIDAGLSAIHVSNAHYDDPQPSSIANNNQILGNLITDTHKLEKEGEFGIFIGSSNNTITGNVVEKQFGRSFINIEKEDNNTSEGNSYR